MLDAGLRDKLINGTAFNLSWLAIVASQSNTLAPLVATVHVCLHMLWIGRGQRELMFIGGVTVFGLLLDQFMFAVGLFTVNGQPAPAPLWLSSLWPVLATTLCHAFSGLQHRLLLAAVLGAIGGFASYSAGIGMSAVTFGHAVYGPLIIAGCWLLLFPALALVARHTLPEQKGAASLA